MILMLIFYLYNILNRRNQNLVRGFFRCAVQMLEIGGEIHVTHKDYQPYDKWKINELTRDEKLKELAKLEFNPDDYPGYKIKKRI